MKLFKKIITFFKCNKKNVITIDKYVNELKATQQMRNVFIKCKTPKEINIQYRSYKTRFKNITLELKNVESLQKRIVLSNAMYNLNIKIKLLENILKIK